MRRYLFILLVVPVLACGGKKPTGLIPREKMEIVLTDILLAESFTETYRTADTGRKVQDMYGEELDRVLAIHKITQKQLMESLDHYKTRPEEFKVIMDSVAAKAGREKDKIYQDAMKGKK